MKKKRRKERNAFTEPLTGRRARHIAGAETNKAYGETLRQNRGLIRATRQREHQVNDWYNTFARQIAESRGFVQGAYNAANAANAQNIQTVGAQGAANQGQLAQQNAQMNQLTGAPGGASPQAQAAAAMANQTGLYGAAIAAPTAAQGANAYSYLTGMSLNARGEGIKQKLNLGKQRRGYQEDRKGLLKEKGQYYTSKLDELREKERNYKIQLRATQLEGKQFNREGRENEANRKIDWYNAKTGRKNSERTESQETGRTPKEKREIREGRHDAYIQLKNLYKSAKKPPRSNKEWAQFATLLAAEQGISPSEAQWAVKKLREQIRETRKGGGGAPLGNPFV